MDVASFTLKKFEAARWPWNFRWNIAAMDRIELLARRHATADEIAFEFDTTSVDIERLCQRNGIYLWSKK